MMYLLDTHVVLWWIAKEHWRLSEVVCNILDSHKHKIFYSIICPWELAIKESKGKLLLPNNFFVELPNLGFGCLSINEKHIQSLRNLPDIHSAPFDRLLAAQAQIENMTLITADRRLLNYPIQLLPSSSLNS